MELNLANKHVLITGGSRGIGLACAKVFLEEGCKVSLVSRSQANLETAKKLLASQVHGSESRIALFSAELQKAEPAAQALDQAEKAFGPVDVLVNSAGAAKRTPADQLSPAFFREAMDAKFFTYINMIDPVIKRMGARGTGVIVNVVGAGGKTPTTVHIAGGSANAALMLTTVGLAAAYGPKGVRINAVNPSGTLTDRLIEGLKVNAEHEKISQEDVLKRMTAQVPMGRLASPEEVADTVVYLASNRASYVTGTVITMDGAAHPVVV
ncbi:SDR family oxidoreductase [Zwartia sp.]|uniref:SDR family oxidoreductase n=1 Tax=Zwartia sp. TaxID=2978004 RepID=UPI00271E20F9|nr:SDR family oxidoreductase [Zwartia sp.]MDO9025778.1 SDR family oxidoreductase [Zwartia sp.]